MILFIFLFTISTITIATPVQNISPRIINGKTAEAHSIPYQVFLVVDSDFGIRWCSGTLITINYVLTTAYCVQSADWIEVRLGVNNRSDFTESTQVTIKSTEYLIYPQFDSGDNTYDIALIKLPTPAVLNDYVQLVRLISANKATANLTEQVGRYSGWGLLSYGNSVESAQLLQYVDAPLISYDDCHNYYNNLLRNTLCTAATNSYYSYCTGDQGGPLMVDGVQVGVLSTGDKVCLWDGGEWPTVFSKVYDYIDWIKSNSDYQG